MRVCVACLLLVLLTVVVEASLRAREPTQVGGPTVQKRPSSDPLGMSSVSTVSDPASDRTLLQQMTVLQMKVDQISSDVTHLRQTADQTASNVDLLMRYFIKTSCTDVAAAAEPAMPLPPASGRPEVVRQTSTDGVYAIFPPQGTPKKVKCDHTSSGDAGWTVVLLRQDGSVEFNRTYGEYRAGFGDPAGEVWIGLDTLRALTAAEPQQLRVEMRDFGGQFAYAHYRSFSVGDQATHFKLSVGGYDPRSTAGDSLKDHNNMLFSTMDVDHDTDGGSCSNQFGGGGGWWFASCYHALGTGRYRSPVRGSKTVTTEYGGVTWHPFSDVKKSLEHFKMLIKPRE